MMGIRSALRRSLFLKLAITVGATLLFAIFTWAYFSINYQKVKLQADAVTGIDRLSTTIQLGTHYAMMLNSRDEINQIINNIARQPGIENIRIYNKEGRIQFSNNPGEIEKKTNIRAEACYICHKTEPPSVELFIDQRTRIVSSPNGNRLLGIISPIYNEPGCSSTSCHVHPPEKKILGALDVVVSLQETDREIRFYQNGILLLAICIFLLTSSFIFLFVLRFVKRPIHRLIEETRRFARGDYSAIEKIDQEDEIGLLAEAVHQMGCEIGSKQAELNKQRDEYQTLFDQVPCIISVQNREYRLVGYNREFSDRFDPEKDDFCFHAYKGRTEKCLNCPVEKTFEDGRSHYSEETGLSKSGNITHWIVKTSPIRNAEGEIVAAMEMSLDITHRKRLEDQLEKSERKYHEIFNNIPNPLFVLDFSTLNILDCNQSVVSVYGYNEKELLGQSFLKFFHQDEIFHAGDRLRTLHAMDRARHLDKDGKTVVVNIRISPSGYPGRKILLVTTSDITQRLETEQQLIQTSKMATLGEMATGVAHELNQPLSVIKTASSFLMKKVQRGEPIENEILSTMAEEIDRHVDRATKIITHMRQFGRKADHEMQPVQLNDVLFRAMGFFSQQLKVRGIEVNWQVAEELPAIMADADRLEQVFINLFINARDAIVEKIKGDRGSDKKIMIQTCRRENRVVARIKDSGTGVSPGLREKIFEPFFTTKEVGSGTGLGLSISYGIIQDCGGTIRLTADTGNGACFEISFPASGEDHAES